MDRIKTAVILPLIVFPMAAAVAIAIGILLLQMPHGVATWVALAFVVVATTAGFIASSRVGGSEGSAH